MYEKYADGRHEELLEIAGDSKKEFAEWLDGTHPKREGEGIHGKSNAVVILHILICMFLAIQGAGLLVTIADPEGIHKRLLAQDNIGIVPCYDFLR